MDSVGSLAVGLPETVGGSVQMAVPTIKMDGERLVSGFRFKISGKPLVPRATTDSGDTIATSVYCKSLTLCCVQYN